MSMLRNLSIVWPIALALVSPITAPAAELSHFPFTAQGAETKLRREFTGLGFPVEVSLQEILEYVRARRGGDGPLLQDEDQPEQLVLVDAQGKKWKTVTDGWVPDVRNERGESPLVFEAKAQWFKNDALDRMHLAFEALIASGAQPHYAYGGGHIHLDVKPKIQNEPVVFASLLNLSLTYEPVLLYLMSHQIRGHQARSLSFTRLADGTTLAQYLGRGLNALLDDPSADCRQDARLKRYLNDHPEVASLQGRCILAFISHFATEVVDDRTYAINLQSWKGAKSRRKVHGSVEYRFFNAPKSHFEASLEERLVRLLADRAWRAQGAPIRYVEKSHPAYDLDSFYAAYFPDAARAQFTELLVTLGVSREDQRLYLDEYLARDKQLARRMR